MASATKTDNPVIVLIPGGWHFPQCFDLFGKELNSHGYETSYITHKSVLREGWKPVESHHEDAAAIHQHVQKIIDEGKDVVALAHSYGGTAATQGLAGLAKKDSTTHGVTRIVFLTAFVPDEGQSHRTFFTDPELSGLLPTDWIEFADDGRTCKVIPTRGIDALYHDVEPRLAAGAMADLGTQSSSVFASPVTKVAWKEIPSSYVYCTGDRAISLLAQQWMVQQAGITDTAEIATSHSPFLSRPDELARIVDRIIQSA